MFDVVALGELLIDFIPITGFDTGSKVYEMNPGGAPANVLAAVSKLGGETAFIGMVGNDSFGHFLKDKLISYGIGTEGLIQTQKANTTLAFVHLDEEGERSFSFYRNPGADTLLEEGDLDLELIEKAKIFHFGSLSMSEEPARSATLKAVRYAKAAGKLVSYDPNWRPLLWRSEATAIAEMSRVLENVDILKVSEDELALLTGVTSPEAGSIKLIDKGIKLVTVTLGQKGCYFRYAKGAALIDAYSTKAVDTTGAGDAFMGGLLYCISKLHIPIDEIDEDEMKDMIDFSNAVGALCVSKRGAIPAMPSMEEINEWRKK